MKKLLLLAYEFPPMTSGGSFRPWKFANHLSHFGIEVTVVTPQREQKLNDSDLNFSLEYTEPVEKLAFEKLYHSFYLNVLDPEAKKWKKPLVKKLEELMQLKAFDAMMVTAPPFSISSLAVSISKRFNLPLIVDLRDAWSQWIMTPYASLLHYQILRRIEAKVFNNAAAIISVTEQLCQNFRELHPSNSGKIHYVPNAYEEPLQIDEKPLLFDPKTDQNPFIIGYVGSFYFEPYQRDLIFNPWWKKKPWQYLQYVPHKEDWKYRSPYYFFKAIRLLLDKRPDLNAKIQIKFIGTAFQWLKDMIQLFNLENHVELLGKKNHSESLLFQKNCDALLLTSVKVIGGKDYCIAGKSFEYLSMEKPILGFLTEGSQKDFLEKTGLGVLCDPDDTERSSQTIENLLDFGTVLTPQANHIKDFSINITTEKLARIILKLTQTQ